MSDVKNNTSCIKTMGSTIVGTCTVIGILFEIFNFDAVQENTYVKNINLNNNYVEVKQYNELLNKYDTLLSESVKPVLNDYIKKVEVKENYVLKSTYMNLYNEYTKLTSMKVPIITELKVDNDFWSDSKLNIKIETLGDIVIGERYIYFNLTLPDEETKEFKINKKESNRFSKRFYYEGQPYNVKIKQFEPLIFEINKV